MMVGAGVAGLVAWEASGGEEVPGVGGARLPATVVGVDSSVVEGSSDEVVVEGSLVAGEAVSEPVLSVLESRTEQGAIASVLVFLELSEEIVGIAIDDAVATQDLYVAESVRVESASELRSELEVLVGAFGPDVEVQVAPISWSGSGSGDEMVVTVWYVEVFSAGPVESRVVAGAFRTYSARVVWERGRWRLVDGEVIDGPYPSVVAAPTEVSTLLALTEGFTDGDSVVPLLVGGDR